MSKWLTRPHHLRCSRDLPSDDCKILQTCAGKMLIKGSKRQIAGEGGRREGGGREGGRGGREGGREGDRERESRSPTTGPCKQEWVECEFGKLGGKEAARAARSQCCMVRMFQRFRNASGFIKGKNLPSAGSSSPGDLLEARMAKVYKQIYK